MIFSAILDFIPLNIIGQFNTLGVSAACGFETTLHSSRTSLKAEQSLDTIQKGEKENREMPQMHAPLKSLHITSSAGWRIHPVTGKLTLHQGIDLRADFEPVYSVMDGKVEKAVYDQRSGFYIRLVHSPFCTTSYAHLSVIKVKEGEKIKAGEVIGISGNSGTSTGPHFHFRIHYTNTSIIK
jgi:murein DD-endopeptidase MepM/ murein hydrolase activator NlpD